VRNVYDLKYVSGLVEPLSVSNYHFNYISNLKLILGLRNAVICSIDDSEVAVLSLIFAVNSQ
jgi:hypothetical protein